MDETAKGKRWRPSDVVAMLDIIKNKNIMQLMDGKHKRNKAIFDSIHDELKEKGVVKSVDQIKTKFKSLKANFFKTKRHNSTSGNSRQECEHYELLEEILQHRPLAALSGVDTIMDDVIEFSIDDICEVLPLDQTLPAPLSATSPALNDPPSPALNGPPSPALNSSSSPALNSSSSPATGSKTSLRAFKNTQKRTYQNVISSFNGEWKSMQEDMFKKAKEQEKELIEEIKENDKTNLEQLKLILENDRKEAMKEFKEMFNLFPT